jgi:hypothetical protein
LTRNPARPSAVRGPRQTKPDIRPFGSWTQVEAVAERAGDYGALIRFACATGLRPEEWAALTWADVDFAARTVAINKVWAKGELRSSEGKTDAAFRIVSLQEPAPCRAAVSPTTAPERAPDLCCSEWRLLEPRQLASSCVEEGDRSLGSRLSAATGSASSLATRASARRSSITRASFRPWTSETSEFVQIR